MGGNGEGGAEMGGAPMAGNGTGGAPTGMGGAAMGGSSMGGSSMGGASGGDIDRYVGLWAGSARKGGDRYDIEISVTPGSLGELIGTVYIPAPYHCGAITRLESVNTTALVYRETLVFGTIASCIGSGVATLRYQSPDVLDYGWILAPGGGGEHRGTLNRRPRTGSALSTHLMGLWTGTLTQTNPSAQRLVYVAFAQAGVSDAIAHILYPSMGNGCGGRLTLRSGGGTSLSTAEVLTSTGMGCLPSGLVALTLGGSNLGFAWSSVSSNTTANSTLLLVK
jgi:hypothetical protein